MRGSGAAARAPAPPPSRSREPPIPKSSEASAPKLPEGSGASSSAPPPPRRALALDLDAPSFVTAAQRAAFDLPWPTCVPDHEAAPNLPVTHRFFNAAGAVGLRWGLLTPPPLPTPDDERLAEAAVAAEAAPPRLLREVAYGALFSALLHAEAQHLRAASCQVDLRAQPPLVCRIADMLNPDLENVVTCVMHVPGVADGLPRLERGSIVRMRTRDTTTVLPATLRLIGLFSLEVEASVLDVNVAREEVTLRLPSRLATRVCQACAWGGPDSMAAIAAADRIVMRATHLVAPCLHQVFCAAHASVATVCQVCLCSVTGFLATAASSGWGPVLPAHLAGATAGAGDASAVAAALLSAPAAPLPLTPADGETLRQALRAATEKWALLLAACSFDVRFERDTGDLIRMRAASASAGRALLDAASATPLELAPTSSPLRVEQLLQLPLDDSRVALALEVARLSRQVSVGERRVRVTKSAVSLLAPWMAPRLAVLPSLFPQIDDLLRPQCGHVDEALRLGAVLRLMAMARISELLVDGVKLPSHPRAATATAMAEGAARDGRRAALGVTIEMVRSDAQFECAALLKALNLGPARFAELCAPGERRLGGVPGAGDVGDGRVGDHVTATILRPLALPVSTFFAKGLNALQCAAVEAIVGGAHGCVPYLLLGPAGTGKSSVLIEVILQLLVRLELEPFVPTPATLPSPKLTKSQQRAARAERAPAAAVAQPPATETLPRQQALLLVAPSNEAADLLLHHLDSSYRSCFEELGLAPAAAAYLDASAASTSRSFVLRLNSCARSTDTMRPELLAYAFNERGAFTAPPADVLGRSRLVVCAASAVSEMVPEGFGFSHLIVDEASQAIEPEALRMLMRVCGASTHVVLSGDTRQLGAHIASSVARAAGLGVSLQERLHAGATEAVRAAPNVTSGASLLEGEMARALSRNDFGEGKDNGAVEDGTSGADASLSLAAVAASLPALPTASAISVYEALPRMLHTGAFVALHATSEEGDCVGQRRPARKPDVEAAVAVPANTGSFTLQSGLEEASASESGLEDAVLRFAGASGLWPLGFLATHVLQTTLTVNYRANADLLDLPSRLFYFAAPLVSKACGETTQRCLSWSLLRRRGAGMRPPYPLLALGVDGDDTREAAASSEAISYVNVDEAKAIVWLCRSLLSESQPARAERPDEGLVQRPAAVLAAAGALSGAASTGALTLTTADIAVISPFRQQVLLVRKLLREAGLGGVNVGNVLNLQGAERPCVICCTVLGRNHGVRLVQSRPAARAAAATAARPFAPEPVGLFHDPKSLNVCLTRAQSLTIVVGNPRIWELEHRFRELLYTAVDHDSFAGFAGCTLPEGVRKRAGALF